MPGTQVVAAVVACDACGLRARLGPEEMGAYLGHQPVRCTRLGCDGVFWRVI